MVVTRFNPFREFKEFENKFLSHFPTIAEEGGISTFQPSVSTREDELAYHIEVDLPGVKKEDINVDIKEHKIVISGERSFKKERKEKDYYSVESSYGKFARTFSLPEDVDSSNIEAFNKDGVLEVTLPKRKSEKVKAKKIEVKEGETPSPFEAP